MEYDDKDQKILSLLLRAADMSKAEIARRVGVAASAISERMRKLEATGVITGYAARLKASTLGYPLLAYVFVREVKPNDGHDTAADLMAVTGVEEVHKIAGEDCFLLKLRVRGTDELADILDSEINPIRTVAGVRTTIVLRTMLEAPPLWGRKEFDPVSQES